MKVELINIATNSEMVDAQAAAICTNVEPSLKVLNHAVKSGHTSVLEHTSFTFRVEGVSRALLAQLTRHRHASFSVQSQRYVAYNDGFGYVTPPSIKALGAEAEKRFSNQMERIARWYTDWLAQIDAEDARFVLPNACETNLIVTMNTRALLHFFSLRCCTRAQWEIRKLANEMLKIMQSAMPNVFKNGGAYCDQNGYCKEARSCGRAPKLKDLLALWNAREE